MVRYALAAEEKEVRRRAILHAARTLFVADPEKLPSASAIAVEAGLAKGTVYLYFLTKEEIFMDLLHADRMATMRRVQDALKADDRLPGERIAAFLDGYVSHVAAHPDMLRLESLGYSVVERNVDRERLRAYKVEFTTALMQSGAAVEATLSLPAGEGLRALMHSYALTQGLWQALDIPDDCVELMGEAAAPFASLDFATELTAALYRYWRGIGDAGGINEADVAT